MECDYQLLGIYFQLKAEIKQGGIGGIEISYYIGGDQLKIKGDDHWLGIKRRYDGGTNLSYSYRPYSSIRRLEEYTFVTTFDGKTTDQQFYGREITNKCKK